MEFLPAHDPRMRSTVAAIEAHLTFDGLVFRYATETGVDSRQEAPFLFCSFWLVDNYAMTGRLHEAHELLERLMSLSPGCPIDRAARSR